MLRNGSVERNCLKTSRYAANEARCLVGSELQPASTQEFRAEERKAGPQYFPVDAPRDARYRYAYQCESEPVLGTYLSECFNGFEGECPNLLEIARPVGVFETGMGVDAIRPDDTNRVSNVFRIQAACEDDPNLRLFNDSRAYGPIVRQARGTEFARVRIIGVENKRIP